MSLHPRAPAGSGERRVRRSPPPAGACLPNAQRSPRSPPTLGFSRVASFVGENTTQFCSLSQKRGPGNLLPLPPRRWRRGSPRCLWWGGLGRLGGAFGVARLRSSWTSCSSSCSCSLSTSPCGGGRVNIPPRRARCPEGACRPNARLAPSVRASRAAVAAFVSPHPSPLLWLGWGAGCRCTRALPRGAASDECAARPPPRARAYPTRSAPRALPQPSGFPG